jgi:putative phosphoesterase
MTEIGIISDTHGYIHPRIFEFFSEVSEVWHAGDLGPGIALQLQQFRPFRAVWGNIDGGRERSEFPEMQSFYTEEVKVLMMHIGGYPGRYDIKSRAGIIQEKPNLFVCGHSHILKVIYDSKFDLLHINPGAAGKYGWHKSITAVRLKIDGKEMKDLEILDIPRL